MLCISQYITVDILGLYIFEIDTETICCELSVSENNVNIEILTANFLFVFSFVQQEIRNQAGEYPFKVAKLAANRNLNRYRDVSPCESDR